MLRKAVARRYRPRAAGIGCAQPPPGERTGLTVRGRGPSVAQLRGAHVHSPAASLIAGIDLARGRLFDTSDLDEARERCARVLNPHALRVVGRGQRLQARMDHLPLGPLSFSRLTWGAEVAVDPDRLERYYLLSMPVAGRAVFHHGGRPTEVSPACAGLVSSAPRFHFGASPDFDQVLVRIERAAVDRGWLALSGRLPATPIEFACALPFGGPAWRAIEPVLRTLADCARGASAQDSMPHLGVRLEDLLVTLLLLHQPHTLGTRAHHPADPCTVHLRRAEDFMRERIEEPLSLAMVAIHCGVSRRTLQAAFQRQRGLGPMQWLRRERLHAARQVLLRGEGAAASVSQAALRFGFGHLGEFSRAYRAAFGEPPSQTRRRR